MKALVLPGYSPGNKVWADKVKESLGEEVVVIYWRHWTSGGTLSLKYETGIILEKVGSEKVNFVAKSVGTFVCAKILPKIKNQVGKIILCGIPSTSEKRKETYIKAFRSFPAKKIICFQNENDPFTTFDEVKKFMREINSEIKVIKKERSDHDYPYFEDFQKFLS